MNRFFHYRETVVLIKGAVFLAIVTYGERSILDAIVSLIDRL